MTFKITNSTKWRTADLRRLFIAGLDALGASHHRHVRVTYTHGRRNRNGECGGYAYYGHIETRREGHEMMMALPRGDFINIDDLARTWKHEVCHTLGLRHGDMDGDTRDCSGPCPEWAAGLEVHAKAPKPKPAPVSIVEVREARARANLERWEARLKSAQRRVAKLRAKIRGYERRAAAKAVP